MVMSLGWTYRSMIIENLESRANEDMIGKYEESVYMMKFNEVKVMKLGDDTNGNSAAQ